MTVVIPEEVGVWEVVRQEPPDFSLLDNELKEVCISIAEDERYWYANKTTYTRIETTNCLGSAYRCIRTIDDIELACRVHHAMREYIALIEEAQRRQREETLNRKISKYDAMAGLTDDTE